MAKHLLQGEGASSNRTSLTLRRLLLLASFTLISLAASAQNRTISGTVVDTKSEPVIGASIIIEGTTRGITTGADGSFTLTDVPTTGNLLVTMLGYTNQTVPLSGQTNYRIVMDEGVEMLEELVVVGYGVMRKSDVTGAVISVREAQLQERPVTNAFEALQGRAAGVDITTGARPGELGRIRIRGERSITATSEPLYVVDGIPLQGNTDISMLSTYDIQSIEILKDASATAIYGSRGANGVVLVTTKKGEAGKFSITYNGSVALSTLQDSQERYNAAEWIDFTRWAYYYSNPTTYPRADQPTRDTDFLMFGMDPYAWSNVEKGWSGGSWDGSKVQSTDWTDYVSRTGITQNHSIGVSGGTDKISSRASFGYVNERGTIYGQGMERYNFNVTTVLKPKKWFELGASVTGAYTEQDYGMDRTGGSSNSGPPSAYAAALRLYPYAVPYDDDGNRILKPGGDDALNTVVDEHKYSTNKRERLQIIANVYAQVQLPVDGLSYRFTFGPGFRFQRNGIFISPESAALESTLNLTRLSNNRQTNWNLQNQINYLKTIGKHHFGVTLVQEASKYIEVRDNINARNQPVEDALWNNMGAIDRANDLDGIGSDLVERQIASYLFRANYSFNDRYILTATGRWDGSSVLAPGNKWAFFPSVAVAWRMEQEEFMKGIDWIYQMKLRVGYGITGNAAVDPYTTIGNIFSSLYPYGENTSRYYYINDLLATSSRNRLPDSSLGWEKTHQLNIGLDFSVLKSRINGTLEFYTSRTTDLLLEARIPSITGYLTTLTNVGETKNKGVDITLNTVNVRAGAFTWETSLNMGWQRNKITKLSNGKEDEIDNEWFIGHPLGVFYGYEAVGIWKEEDAKEMEEFNKNGHEFTVGTVRIKDQNGDNIISANDDRVIIGNRNPTWTWGMGNTFTWKGIDLSVMINSRMGFWTNGGDINGGGKYMSRKVSYYNENNKENATHQRPFKTQDGSDITPYISALTYSKASYINVRHISLGYMFPSKIVQRWGMDNLRVYTQVVNPFSIYQACDFKNMDVGREGNESSSTQGNYLWNRQFIFGISLSF
ncbi:MAG: TonB-dependent receptor [Alistipes sp.]|nr:TonB-dependent receptor [Alistipes sp.]